MLHTANRIAEEKKQEFRELLGAPQAHQRPAKANLVIAGLGAAGTAIAHLLDSPGASVIAIERDNGLASSLRNQKWRQGGPYYFDKPGLAKRLFESFVAMNRIERRRILNAGAQFLMRSEETLASFNDLWAEQYAYIERATIAPNAVYNDPLLGECLTAGGLRGPDSVMDFPALLSDIRTNLTYVQVLGGANIKQLVREGDAITGAVFEQDGVERRVRCNHLVITLGAWTAEILNDAGVNLDLQLHKSHIVTVQRELVPRITVWCDKPRVTLVPYKGTTLISNRSSVPVQDPSSVHTPDQHEVERIKHELASVFPDLKPEVFAGATSRACLKAELAVSPQTRNQDASILTEHELGVSGLTVVVTGKASLMFSVAEQVKSRLLQVAAKQDVTDGDWRPMPETLSAAANPDSAAANPDSAAVNPDSPAPRSETTSAPRPAIVFTHLPVNWESLGDNGYLNGLTEQWAKRLRAFASCDSLRLVYIYVSAAVEQVLKAAASHSERLEIPGDTLEKEQAIFNALHRALKLSESCGSLSGESKTTFEFVGVQKLTRLLNRLQAIDPRLIGYLRGRSGAFTYDSPKMVESVIRIARGMDFNHAHAPIIRLDADVEPNEEAIRGVVDAFWRRTELGERCIFLSGGYRGPNGFDLLNSFAVRTHWFDLPDFAHQFLRDLGEVGAPQTPPQTPPSATARRLRIQSRPLQRETQPISGAGLVMSTAAIRRLPPFANMNHPTVWVDDWLKRCLHEAIGDIPAGATQRVAGADFVQDRHPEGLSERDFTWARDHYIERLVRGCMMQAMIIDEEMNAAPLSVFVHELVAHQRQNNWSKKELSKLRKELVAAGSKRLGEIAHIWSSEAYGNSELAAWIHRVSPARRDELARSVAQDAMDYLRLVAAWPIYRDAIELLSSHDAYWLFLPVESDELARPVS